MEMNYAFVCSRLYTHMVYLVHSVYLRIQKAYGMLYYMRRIELVKSLSFSKLSRERFVHCVQFDEFIEIVSRYM